MEMLDGAERSNLLEIIDTRYGRVSTIVASQLPVEKWYGMIGEATFAEAILDRLIHRAVRVVSGRDRERFLTKQYRFDPAISL
jgi:DNA replication protein DnaC